MTFVQGLVIFLFGLLGIVIHVAFKFFDVVTKEPKNGRSFNERLGMVIIKFDLLKNVTYAGVALLIVLLAVLLGDTLTEWGIPITKITIIFVGYAADSWFKNLSNLKQ